MRRYVPGRGRWSTATGAPGCPKDVVAGLVLAALLVPQGMAYAELAGLPAITGLYTSILCLLGVRGLRPVAHPGARPGLVARADDRRDDPAAGRRRTATPRGRWRWRRCWR